TAIDLSYSGSGPDMFGLVSSILEEPSKPEPVTDWTSLSRLFPLTWGPDFGSHGESSGLSSKHSVESKDFSELVGTQSYSQEPLQKPHHVEMLHRGLEDLHLMESWLSPSGPQPVDTLQNSCAENVSSQDEKTVHPEGFVCQNSGCHPLLGSYDHVRLNGDYQKIGSNLSPFSAPNRMKEGTSIQKECWEPERARGKALKNAAQEQAKYSPARASQPVDASWGKASQDNPLFSKRHKNFPAAHKLQASLPPSFYFFNQAPKENKFSGGTDRKPQETHVQNSPCSFTSGGASHDEYPIQMSPNECSPKVSEYDPAVKKLMENGSYSSCCGHTWLEGAVANPAAVSGVPCGKGMGTSPQSSSGASATSGVSPTHPYYPQISPLLPRKGGRLHRPNGASHNLGVSNFITEDQKLMKPIGQSQHDPLPQEGQYHQLPVNFSSAWLTQQNTVSEDPEKHHRLPKKQTQETSNKDNRRGRRNWIPHFGSATPNHQQFSVLQKPHKQNSGTLGDFINPPFLPSFPLMSDFKQNPSFPPFHPHLLSSPNHFSFPPSPLLFSELVDLHYKDFSHLNPLTQHLFCGEPAAPCFAFPAPFKCRPPRGRSGAANELHLRLEECYEQCRALEEERKK
ncbi:PREDICTED: uncharacterized protein C17orf104 homolog, partial [Merops nubicus]|uniref:uncharacterized protein C17orf104 homolog n=1 Tax=Merops nubicus TaxID=57421 RepID=UPI0004F06665